MIDENKTTSALAKVGESWLDDPKPEPKNTPMFLNVELMREVYQIATIFSASNLVPDCYRGGEKSVGRANCFAALSMGFELGIAPMQALSHIVVVNGRPAIDGQLAISLANKRANIIGGISYDEGGEGDAQYCIAWTTDRDTRERKDYKITIADAKKAGWFNKAHSHWQKDPRLMLRYRAASYLIRTNYPDAVMGLHTVDELEDAEAQKVEAKVQEVQSRLDNLNTGGQDERETTNTTRKSKTKV
jgi:hypothetical protein